MRTLFPEIGHLIHCAVRSADSDQSCGRRPRQHPVEAAVPASSLLHLLHLLHPSLRSC